MDTTTLVLREDTTTVQIVEEDVTIVAFSTDSTVVEVGEAGPPGAGVPAGGTDTQVLAKASNADYDTEWVAAGGGGGGAPVIIQDGPPVEGGSAFSFVQADGTITSGSFTLTVDGHTTASIDGLATWQEINDAVNTAFGADAVFCAFDDPTLHNLNDGLCIMVFKGLYDLSLADVTVASDTTDGGVSIAENDPGVPPTPTGVSGQILVDETNGVVYQYAARFSTLNMVTTHWQRVVPILGFGINGPFTGSQVRIDEGGGSIYVVAAGINGAEYVILETFQTSDGEWRLEQYDQDSNYIYSVYWGETRFVFNRFVNGVLVSTLTLNTDGSISLPNLPTSDPGIAGELYSDSGVVKISL